MSPGFYKFLPREGGEPRYAIIKFVSRGRLRVRFVDFKFPSWRRSSPPIMVETALRLGRLVPLVPADESGNGVNHSTVGRKSGRDQLQGISGDWHQLFQPYFAGYNEHGAGLWYGHERPDEVVRDGAEPYRPKRTKQRRNELPCHTAVNEPATNGYLRPVESEGDPRNGKPHRPLVVELAALLDSDGAGCERRPVAGD